MRMISSTFPILYFIIVSTHAFQYTSFFPVTKQRPSASSSSSLLSSSSLSSSLALSKNDNINYSGSTIDRRVFVSFVSGLVATPLVASAGIDVSGLTVEGSGNSVLRDQLRAYDGSASARVAEIQARSSPATRTPTSPSSKPFVPPAGPGIATWALRANEPRIQKIGLGTLNRYEGYLMPPQGPKGKSIYTSFEFPSDWLQLDRANGCVQFVDQRNGDKLYLLRATLPDEMTLTSAPKSFFAEAIFDPKGSIAKSGTNPEDYRVVSSKVTECPSNACAARRRMRLKYSTVTGNGLRVERRGLVDAYQIDNDVYMILTSSNAVKFDKGGIERETVEKIVESFTIDRA